MVIPSLLNSCKGNPVSGTAASYMDHFEVTPEQLQKVLATALEKGADYADLYFEHTVSNATSLQDKKVNSAYSDITFGVGIRVLKGDQTGFAYAENTSMESMLRAAKTAASIADINSSWSPALFNEVIPSALYNISTPWESVVIKDKIPFITSLNDKIFAGDQRITKVNISLSDSTTYILFYNSEGVLSWEKWRS